MPTVIPRATVIGDGGMGTLCALLLARQGSQVTLWGAFPEHIEELERDRENKQFLPGFALPDSIKPVSNEERAFDQATLIVSAVPCQYVRAVWQRFIGCAPRDVPVVSINRNMKPPHRPATARVSRGWPIVTESHLTANRAIGPRNRSIRIARQCYNCEPRFFT